MLKQIVEAENELEKLLPIRRLESSPPAELLHAALLWSELIWQQAVQQGPVTPSEAQLKDGLALLQRPVFICGVHRSGTTLVQNLMDGHPQLAVLPSEGTFYTNQELKLKQLPVDARRQYLGTEWLRRMANPINQSPYFLLGRSDEFRSPYVDFARCFLAWWDALSHKENTQWPHSAIVLAYASCTNNLKASYWVDKTPTNERFLKRIWTEFPDAKIIHVVRDPIAILASRKVMEPGITLRNALRYLKISYRVATEDAIVHNPRFSLVRYEDLCNDPDEIMTNMANFLEIENTPGLKQATTTGIATHANSSFKKDALSGLILKSGEHAQRDVFTSAEKKLIAASVGREAAALGYSIDRINGLSKIYTQLKYALFN